MDYEKALKDIPAPAPGNRKALCYLQIHPDTVATYANAGKRTKLFEMLYNVCGIVPPVPNIGFHEQEHVFPDHHGGVKHACSLFQGINRPYKDNGRDGEIFVYIVKPKFFYEYIAHMVCVAQRQEVPEDALFAIYVNFEDPDYNDGVILGWEWIPADTQDCYLPEDHEERYEKRVW
ncbi:hypothetical protein [Marinobacter adhaerens]|uniref:Uncharacterized protein n=2 Tax=Marinobacter adhaerens TaxID=1033846 RepID=A0ABX8IDD5_9GAMM|nr:hypothetical protein [Marinobacter adhaerens]ADP97772.1 conserved hypothetical protein [Marinobacter adhaerens HP15]QWV11827.1 hypothetical protein KQ249_14160 [Marinobacter adhaerens]